MFEKVFSHALKYEKINRAFHNALENDLEKNNCIPAKNKSRNINIKKETETAIMVRRLRATTLSMSLNASGRLPAYSMRQKWALAILPKYCHPNCS